MSEASLKRSLQILEILLKLRVVTASDSVDYLTKYEGLETDESVKAVSEIIENEVN